MNNWLNYHHLYYFKIIAEEGSVSKAAQKLLLGQPTLSAQLKQFEESIGVKLFDRKHKKLVLTEHGRIALNYAKEIFRAGNEMIEVLNDRIAAPIATLSVGALDSIPKQVIVKIVQEATRLRKCELFLLEGKYDELVRELITHKIDILVTNFLPTSLTHKNLFYKQIAKANIYIYGSRKFLKIKKNFPYSIQGVPIVLPTSEAKLRQDLDHWAKLNKLQLDVLAESQDIAVKKMMATEGLGIIPATSFAVEKQVKDGDLIMLGKLPMLFEELFLVSASRKIENPIAHSLMKSFTL